MYNNADHIEVGKKYYKVTTGEYVFTSVYNGVRKSELLESGKYPDKVVVSYGDWTSDHEVFAVNEETGALLDEDDMLDICYNDVVVDAYRIEELKEARAKIEAIITDAEIKEPFVFDGRDLKVGKEHVLSAHINAGYEHGWISSSICW